MLGPTSLPPLPLPVPMNRICVLREQRDMSNTPSFKRKLLLVLFHCYVQLQAMFRLLVPRLLLVFYRP